MAHALDQSTGKPAMFYAADGGVPWHGLGTAVPTAATSKEAIVAAGLGWTVSVQDPGNIIKAPWHTDELRFVVREDTRRIITAVRGGYQPIQNTQMFDWMDALVKDKVMHYETAGSLWQGNVVWIMARMDKDMRVGKDAYQQYLFAMNYHDGTGSMRAFLTPVRVVCANTLKMAVDGKDKTSTSVKIKHTGKIQDKLDKAAEVMAITTATQRRMKDWLNGLLDVPVKADQFEEVHTRLFGKLDDSTATQRRKAIGLFKDIYDAEAKRQGENAYSLIQTVTGYYDHGVKPRARDDHEERMQAFVLKTEDSKEKAIITIADVLSNPAVCFSGELVEV